MVPSGPLAHRLPGDHEGRKAARHLINGAVGPEPLDVFGTVPIRLRIKTKILVHTLAMGHTEGMPIRPELPPTGLPLHREYTSREGTTRHS